MTTPKQPKSKDPYNYPTKNRTLGDKVADFWSSKDFFGASDGGTDDTAAINLAIAELAAGGEHAVIFLPRNTKYVEANLVLHMDVTLIDMATKGMLKILSKNNTASLPFQRGGLVIKTQGIDGVLMRVHDSGITGAPYVQLLNEATGNLADIRVRGVNLTNYQDIVEISDPAAPPANTARMFTRDNGSGKTQLCVRFNTGVVQVISTEP